jgi:hypothetical protein
MKGRVSDRLRHKSVRVDSDCPEVVFGDTILANTREAQDQFIIINAQWSDSGGTVARNCVRVKDLQGEDLFFLQCVPTCEGRVPLHHGKQKQSRASLREQGFGATRNAS